MGPSDNSVMMKRFGFRKGISSSNNSDLKESLIDNDADSGSRQNLYSNSHDLANFSAIDHNSTLMSESRTMRLKGFGSRRGSINLGIATPLFLPNDMSAIIGRQSNNSKEYNKNQNHSGGNINISNHSEHYEGYLNMTRHLLQAL